MGLINGAKNVCGRKLSQTHMHTLGMESMILTVCSSTQRSVRLKYFAVVTASNLDKVRYLLRFDSFSHRNPQPGRMIHIRGRSRRFVKISGLELCDAYDISELPV